MMRWRALLLVIVDCSLIAGSHARQLRIEEDTAFDSENPTFSRNLLQNVLSTDTLLGGLPGGANCLYTASSTPSASQCLVSANGNYRLCLQTGGCKRYYL